MSGEMTGKTRDDGAAAPRARGGGGLADGCGCRLDGTRGQGCVDAETAGLREPNTLLYVSAGLYGSGITMLSLLVVASAREGLRPGGALHQLKAASKTKISPQSNTLCTGCTLLRWRVFSVLISALVALYSVYVIVNAILQVAGMFDTSRGPTKLLSRILFGVAGCTAIPIGLVGWWTSMYIASCLCREDIIQVIDNIRSIEPVSGEWEARVAEPALRLINKMELLSDGWSGGLVGLAGGCWLVALAHFVWAINDPFIEGLETAPGDPMALSRRLTRTVRMGYVLVTAGLSLVPFLLMKDIADTSSKCTELMKELNDARTRHGPESHLKIRWLEVAFKQLVRSGTCVTLYSRCEVASELWTLRLLPRQHYLTRGAPAQNHGGGLGFKLLGLGVVDNKLLTELAAKLFAGLSTAVATLLTLAEEAALSGDGSCMLTTFQTSTIRGVMAGANASCYNITLGTILN